MEVEPDLVAIEAFWADHRAELGGGEQPDHFWFGDGRALADELAELVVSGPKRATAGSVWAVDDGEESMPEVGQLSIVLDGSGRPVAVIRTTEVRVGPLSSVSEQFAWDEGEGDRTRAWWLAAHERFFRRQGARAGWEFTPDHPTVFERFELVWPG